MKESNDFLKKVLSIIDDLSGSASAIQVGDPCSIYKMDDIVSYVRHTMSDSKILQFEEHALNCPACLRLIYIENDKLENKNLYQKALLIMDEIDKEDEKGIVKIILRVAGKAIELIKTTGEFLMPPSPVPVMVRGEEGVQEHVHPLCILKEFTNIPLSIQCTIEAGENVGDVKLTVSVYNKDSEAFMTDLDITLTGSDIHEEGSTDKNGEAAFHVKSPGDYRIIIKAIEDQEQCMDISLND